MDVLETSEAYASFAGNIVEYETYEAALADMEAGNLDVMIVDELYGSYLGANGGKISSASAGDPDGASSDGSAEGADSANSDGSAEGADSASSDSTAEGADGVSSDGTADGAGDISVAPVTLYASTMSLIEDQYAIGLRKEDAELTARLNEALWAVGDKGIVSELQIKWFGRDLSSEEDEEESSEA